MDAESAAEGSHGLKATALASGAGRILRPHRMARSSALSLSAGEAKMQMFVGHVHAKMMENIANLTAFPRETNIVQIFWMIRSSGPRFSFGHISHWVQNPAEQQRTASCHIMTVAPGPLPPATVKTNRKRYDKPPFINY
jgi:hypothetical protein